MNARASNESLMVRQSQLSPYFLIACLLMQSLTACMIGHPLTGLLPGSSDDGESNDLLALGALAGLAGAIGGTVILPGTRTPMYVDVSAGQTTGSGNSPSAAVDLASQKLVFVTSGHLSGRPALFRCNLDGSACVFTDISAGQGNSSGQDPSLVIDSANAKILALTQNGNIADGLSLFRCNLDGSGCAHTDISTATGQGATSGKTPSAVIDTINNRLLVAAENAANGDRPSLYRCNLDGTGCTHTDISAGQGANSGGFTEARIDFVNQKLLVVTQDGSNSNRPSLFRCNLDGTACTHADLSAGQGTNPAQRPDPVIDTLNSKLLVFGRNSNTGNALSMYRCDLDGANCTHTDISTVAGQGGNAVAVPSAVIDSVGNKVLIAVRGPDFNRPALFRCDLDGTNCTFTDISDGQGANSGRSPSAVIDTLNSTLLVVTENGANGDRPALFIQ